jgi:hypothetical protein
MAASTRDFDFLHLIRRYLEQKHQISVYTFCRKAWFRSRAYYRLIVLSKDLMRTETSTSASSKSSQSRNRKPDTTCKAKFLNVTVCTTNIKFGPRCVDAFSTTLTTPQGPQSSRQPSPPRVIMANLTPRSANEITSTYICLPRPTPSALPSSTGTTRGARQMAWFMMSKRMVREGCIGQL